MAVRTTTLGHKGTGLQATNTIGAKAVGATDMNAVRIILGRAVNLAADPTTTGPMSADHPAVTNAIGTAVVMFAVGKRVLLGIPLGEMREAAVRDQGLMIDT